MLDHRSSLRLRLLNFPLIVGVVYIHSYTVTVTAGGITYGVDDPWYLIDFIRIFISQGVARLAVPLFFLISGYFFFRGWDGSWAGYRARLVTRIRTLLLPYLFWTTFVVVIRFIGQSLPVLRVYFTGESPAIATYSLGQLANAILGFAAVPEAYHLWFLRDLMVLMVASPLLFIVLRYMAWPFLIIMLGVWLTASWPLALPDAVGVLFFAAGGYVAMRVRSLFAFDRHGYRFLAVYLIVLLADVVCYEKPYNLWVHRSGIVFGIIATLFLTDRLASSGRMSEILRWLSGASFFVYAAHEPLLGVSRIFAFRVLPVFQPGVLLLTYLFLPVMVITFLVLFHHLLGRCCPGLLKLVTGGR